MIKSARLVDLNALEGKAAVNKINQTLRKCRACGMAFQCKNVLDLNLGSGRNLENIAVARTCNFLKASCLIRSCNPRNCSKQICGRCVAVKGSYLDHIRTVV